MAHVDIERPDLAFDEPILLDGLPGMGLVGKLVTDHVIDMFDLAYYAGVYCKGVPQMAAYGTNDSTVRPPVQIYANADVDLLALVSDVPISPSQAPSFAACITEWLGDNGVTPIYVSGLEGTVDSGDGDEARAIYGLSTGDGGALLDRASIGPPEHAGFVTGPTGALLSRADEVDLDGVGLLIESADELPDFTAARVLIDRGIEPIVDVDIDTEPFVERTIEMSSIAESVIDRVNESADGATRAEPSSTFH